ncbi:MAG: DNA sulfur modification protein DndB [Flavobacteriaceae bacterium]|nr:DNA sulfur modification protein DndB [Flavobacteriaceae bacterium]
MEVKKTKLILPCVRGQIGDWIYYSTYMSAQQITEWVKPAKDIREAKSLDEELQRTLRERAKEIATYLYNRESRFFNSVVIGVYGGLPDWHEFLIENKVVELGGDINEFDSNIGLMEFIGNEQMFAIDGQHRVAGIQFAATKKNQIISKKFELEKDRYPVILVAHIDDELGKKRTRQLFSDINRKAKAVPKKDQIIIDEETLTHIVTRRIFTNYKKFNNGGLIDHIHEANNLRIDDITYFTNITNLDTVIRKLKPLYKKQKNTNDWDEINVKSLTKITSDFFDTVINVIPEFQNFFIKKSITLKELRVDNKYILFRPIGLTLLAKVYQYYIKNRSENEFKKDIKKISFIAPATPLNKILWNNKKMEAKAANQSLAYNLILYLLGNKVDEKKLLNDYRQIFDKTNLPKKIN